MSEFLDPRRFECNQTGEGHHPHWGPVRNTPEDGYQVCRILEIDDLGWAQIDVDGETHRFWNHDPDRLRQVAHSGRDGLIASITWRSPLLRFTGTDGSSFVFTLGTEVSPCVPDSVTAQEVSWLSNVPDDYEVDDDLDFFADENIDQDNLGDLLRSFESITPTLEFDVETRESYCSVSAWMVDERWFVFVNGPEGFRQEYLYLPYETEEKVRAEVAALVEATFELPPWATGD